ncbi:brain protein I3 [Ctenocephalides felis]|uniref:brain protein I3 n=1 Tax=Ctenocephalides felis TaxID=7515 RepID=UPI000E6E1146|nr:brain protein I3 [Ctenocephalides felis]
MSAPPQYSEKPPAYSAIPPEYESRGPQYQQDPRLLYNSVPPSQLPSYGAIPSAPITVIHQPVAPPEIIIVGGCPACRVGVLEDDYTCLGIFCAIFFFPIGILCCLAMKNRRCSNCSAYFG